MSHPDLDKDKDKLFAAIEFIRRMGASQVQIRFSDDVEPTIWMAVALYDKKNPLGIEGFDAAASSTPVDAAIRLCERLADGGLCVHCNRRVGFEPKVIGTMPLNDVICWYQYDPEMKTVRRGCE